MQGVDGEDKTNEKAQNERKPRKLLNKSWRERIEREEGGREREEEREREREKRDRRKEKRGDKGREERGERDIE